jgi:hypothetical protein
VVELLARLRVPDIPNAADSIPLASISGYALPPLELRAWSGARPAFSMTALDAEAFGTSRAPSRAVTSKGAVAAVSASSLIAASSADVRTPAGCDRKAAGGSMNFPRGTNGALGAMVMSCVRARTFSAGSRTSPRGSVM